MAPRFSFNPSRLLQFLSVGLLTLFCVIGILKRSVRECQTGPETKI